MAAEISGLCCVVKLPHHVAAPMLIQCSICDQYVRASFWFHILLRTPYWCAPLTGPWRLSAKSLASPCSVWNLGSPKAKPTHNLASFAPWLGRLCPLDNQSGQSEPLHSHRRGGHCARGRPVTAQDSPCGLMWLEGFWPRDWCFGESCDQGQTCGQSWKGFPHATRPVTTSNWQRWNWCAGCSGKRWSRCPGCNSKRWSRCRSGTGRRHAGGQSISTSGQSRARSRTQAQCRWARGKSSAEEGQAHGYPWPVWRWRNHAWRGLQLQVHACRRAYFRSVPEEASEGSRGDLCLGIRGRQAWGAPRQSGLEGQPTPLVSYIQNQGVDAPGRWGSTQVCVSGGVAQEPQPDTNRWKGPGHFQKHQPEILQSGCGETKDKTTRAVLSAMSSKLEVSFVFWLQAMTGTVFLSCDSCVIQCFIYWDSMLLVFTCIYNAMWFPRRSIGDGTHLTKS